MLFRSVEIPDGNGVRAGETVWVTLLGAGLGSGAGVHGAGLGPGAGA